MSSRATKEKNQQAKSKRKSALGALLSHSDKSLALQALPKTSQTPVASPSNRAISEGRRLPPSAVAVEKTLTKQRLNLDASYPDLSHELKKQDRRSPALLIAFLLLLGFGVLMVMPSEYSTGPAKGDAGSLVAERVSFHRRQTGDQLNRERIGVEFENASTAPRLRGNETKIKTRDVMSGLPLAGERAADFHSRDRLQMPNLSYPDISATYTVKEEQDAQVWEKRAREEYIKAFINNARQDGVLVEVDKQGNVEVIGRGPSSTDSSITKSTRTGSGTTK